MSQDDKTLEERFAAARATAKMLSDSEVNVSLTIGGVQTNELYRIFKDSNEEDTLEGQLNTLDRMLADTRIAALAEAASRMTRAENTEKIVRDLVTARAEEYRVAAAAVRQAIDRKPGSIDKTQTQSLIGELVLMERDERPSEVLVKLLNAARKGKTKVEK